MIERAGRGATDALYRNHFGKGADMAVATSSYADGGLSPLQKTLIGIVAVYVLSVPLFWYLETRLGVSHFVASNTMTVVQILCYAGALLMPWLSLPAQAPVPTSQRLDKMVIVWIFICLTPRLTWELPWLFFLDDIRRGVLEGALWRRDYGRYRHLDERCGPVDQIDSPELLLVHDATGHLFLGCPPTGTAGPFRLLLIFQSSVTTSSACRVRRAAPIGARSLSRCAPGRPRSASPSATRDRSGSCARPEARAGC
jgi:hypothetical protein